VPEIQPSAGCDGFCHQLFEDCGRTGRDRSYGDGDDGAGSDGTGYFTTAAGATRLTGAPASVVTAPLRCGSGGPADSNGVTSLAAHIEGSDSSPLQWQVSIVAGRGRWLRSSSG